MREFPGTAQIVYRDGLNIAATADLGAVDNGAFSLFGIALQGNDKFLLGDLNEDLDTPAHAG